MFTCSGNESFRSVRMVLMPVVWRDANDSHVTAGSDSPSAPPPPCCDLLPQSSFLNWTLNTTGINCWCRQWWGGSHSIQENAGFIPSGVIYPVHFECLNSHWAFFPPVNCEMCVCLTASVCSVILVIILSFTAFDQKCCVSWDHS